MHGLSRERLTQKQPRRILYVMCASIYQPCLYLSIHNSVLHSVSESFPPYLSMLTFYVCHVQCASVYVEFGLTQHLSIYLSYAPTCRCYVSGMYGVSIWTISASSSIRQMEYLSVIDDLLSIFGMEYSIPISGKNLGDYTVVLIPALLS